MRPDERDVLYEEFARFEQLHPGFHVRGLYKETEELRSGFQAAALAGAGPELVYGPSDVLDTFHTMGLLQDMAPWFTDDQRDDFIEGALTYLPRCVDPTKHELVQVGDRFGNHLALVYNRRFIKAPPKTTDELIALAESNTIDEDGDGRKDRYGLVWNFVEPLFRDSVSHGSRRLGLRRAEPAAPLARAGARARHARIGRRLPLHPVAARRVSRRSRQLRLRARRFALQDGPRRDDHQRRLELDRLPDESRTSTPPSPCCRSSARPANRCSR